MKYRELQTHIKPFKAAGLTDIRLNSKKKDLEAEYRKCLSLDLSQGDLETRARLRQHQDISLVSAMEIYLAPEKFSFKTIKQKAFHLSGTSDLPELRAAFPILSTRQLDFRTKRSWAECVLLIQKLTEGTQEIEQFQRDVEGYVRCIKEEKYYSLEGEMAVEEAYSDLRSYVSSWNGSQWKSTLEQGATTQDMLKRAWLEQYLPKQGLESILSFQ